MAHRPRSSQRFPFRVAAFLVSLSIWITGASGPAAATDAPASAAAATSVGAVAPDAEKLFKAIVKVQVRAVPDARSSASLGTEREGTGIVIGEDNLIVTIGYLIVEADTVTLTDRRGRSLPAQVVGYDHPTGLGLLRSVVPLDATPVALGEPGRLARRESVLVVTHEGPDEVTLAQVASRRLFTANWEYLLEQAIFTSPPVLNWSGAALLDKDLRLLGIGSLIVRNATEEGEREPGNMFVPVDALKPILADLVKTGRRAGPARPWLGLAADEAQGRLVVSRVSADGPADSAGIEVGDIILAVGGEPVRTQAEFYRKVWGGGSAGSEVPLRVLQGVEVKDLKLRSIDRIDYFRPKTMH
ncbi:MAG: serine protease [Betaproteobacteria bacterium]|nr:serine protease [Betaproteobacteria bacterium]